MPTLACDISETLMRALEARSRQTGEPVAHIVMSSLADTLEIDHSTLFQVSTSTALVEGVYGGVVTIAELKRHGSFGLGTFDGLDGEMLALDGHFYQVLGDGSVREATDDAMAPFAVVTEFHPECEFAIDRVESFADLTAQLDSRRNTGNLFFAVRIDGRFTYIRTRALCKTASGVVACPWLMRPRINRSSHSPMSAGLPSGSGHRSTREPSTSPDGTSTS